MPIKLNVGLTKKIGQPHYGSLSASCHLEFEAENSLLQNDAADFYEQTRRTFAACRRAVEAELAIGDARRAERPSASAPEAKDGGSIPAKGGAAQIGNRGDAENASGEDAAVQPASASQLDYIRRLASRIGRAAALRIEVLTQHRFGKPLPDLSRDEATRLILTLRAVKAGELDWETALEEAAA
jgi:hypothetical protein